MRFNFKPEGFNVKKMFKKALKVGAVTGVIGGGMPAMQDVVVASAVEAAPAMLDFGGGFWGGLAGVLFSCAINYVGQAVKKD